MYVVIDEFLGGFWKNRTFGDKILIVHTAAFQQSLNCSIDSSIAPNTPFCSCHLVFILLLTYLRQNYQAFAICVAGETGTQAGLVGVILGYWLDGPTFESR